MRADVTEKEDTLSFDPQRDILCISALNSSEESGWGQGRGGEGRGEGGTRGRNMLYGGERSTAVKRINCHRSDSILLQGCTKRT